MRITVPAFVWQQRDFPEPVCLAWRRAQSSFTLEQLNLSQKIFVCTDCLEFEWGAGGSIWWLWSVTVFTGIRWLKREYLFKGRTPFSGKCPGSQSLCDSPTPAVRMGLTLLFWFKQKQKQTKRGSHYHISHSACHISTAASSAFWDYRKGTAQSPCCLKQFMLEARHLEKWATE